MMWRSIRMIDIYLSVIAMAVICALLVALGVMLSKRQPLWLATLLAAGALLGLVAFERWLQDDPMLTRLIPLATVPVWGAWQPAIAAIGVGFAWRLLPGSALRRLVLILPLLILTGVRAWWPIFDKAPPVIARQERGVWMQTTGASCSPAAAATLLSKMGIQSSEKEMSDLCLTSLNGTSTLGLYRGLKIATRGRDVTVVARKGLTKEDLKSLNTPMLLSVYLEPGVPVDPRYTQLWGWSPGVKHTVVFLGFAPDGDIHIADPAVGRESWGMENLDVLWHGEAMYVKPSEQTS